MAHDRHAIVQDLEDQVLKEELMSNPLAGRSVPEAAQDVVPYSFQ